MNMGCIHGIIVKFLVDALRKADRIKEETKNIGDGRPGTRTLAAKATAVFCLMVALPASVHAQEGATPGCTLVSKPPEGMQDVEFDQSTFRAVWESPDRQLEIVSVDPQTGDLALASNGAGQILDTGLAPLPVTENGPEWVQSAGRAEIIYTKLTDEGSAIGSAEPVGFAWHVGIVPGTLGRLTAIGGLDPGDPSPLMAYYVGALGTSETAVREIDNPYSEKLFPVNDARFVPGVRELTGLSTAPGPQQPFLIDYDTGSMVQMFSEQQEISQCRPWIAPEFGEVLVACTLYGVGVRIYKPISSDSWTPYLDIAAPPQETILGEPRSLVYGNSSYIMLSAKSDDSAQPRLSDIWLFGIDPDQPFSRRLTPSVQGVHRGDPESLITDQGPVVYFTQKAPPTEIPAIYRCSTGL